MWFHFRWQAIPQTHNKCYSQVIIRGHCASLACRQKKTKDKETNHKLMTARSNKQCCAMKEAWTKQIEKAESAIQDKATHGNSIHQATNKCSPAADAMLPNNATGMS
jgi:hypothetical protein